MFRAIILYAKLSFLFFIGINTTVRNEKMAENWL